jgi:putative transposase
LDDQQRLAVALRRHAAIAPLLQPDLPRGQRTALVAQLAALYGVSPQSLWRWLQRFRSGGCRLEALMPPPHRADRGRLRALPAEALQQAIRLRQELPERSTTTIIAMLELAQPHWRGHLHRSTLDRHFRRLGLSRRQLGRPDRPLRRFASAHRGDLWIADHCIPGLRWRDGDQVADAILFAVLDHATRLAVGSRFVPNRQAIFVEEVLQDAFSRYGLPKALFLDNAQELSAAPLREACARLGIRLIHSTAGHPESRGALERFFRTVQACFVPEMAAKAMIPILPELNRFWLAWLEEFYHDQPHDGLGHHTSPRQAWEADPAPLPRLDPATIQAAFLLRVTRRVDRTALVRLQGRTYLCPDGLVGQTVQVRYHPARVESVEIWQHDRLLAVAPRYLPPTQVPRQDPPAPRPTPQHTLVDLLDQTRQQRLREQLAAPQILPPPAADFTEAHAAAILEQTLGRNLHERELVWLADAWRRDGGWDPQLLTSTLQAYCARFGTRRHLSWYLQAISQAHLQARQHTRSDAKEDRHV